jgi:hypothetical protein
MSTIDLDLVELRCKLRKWSYARTDDAVSVWPNERTHAAYRAGETQPVWGSGRPQQEDWAVELTRPRLTLADIIADPGEGWHVVRHPEPAYWGFGWGPEPDLHAVVDVDDAGRLMESPTYSETLSLAEMVAAHRAVTDLLVKLAEVES